MPYVLMPSLRPSVSVVRVRLRSNSAAFVLLPDRVAGAGASRVVCCLLCLVSEDMTPVGWKGGRASGRPF